MACEMSTLDGCLCVVGFGAGLTGGGVVSGMVTTGPVLLPVQLTQDEPPGRVAGSEIPRPIVALGGAGGIG